MLYCVYFVLCERSVLCSLPCIFAFCVFYVGLPVMPSNMHCRVANVPKTFTQTTTLNKTGLKLKG